MHRQELTISELKENIDNGWRAVHAGRADDEDNEEGGYADIVHVELICEWRLDDGKIRFVEVPYESPEELAEIKTILLAGIDPFVTDMKKNFNQLGREDETDTKV